MLIVNDISEGSYVKLLNYLIDKCDTISLTQYYNQHASRDKKVIDAIAKKNPDLLKDILTSNIKSDQLDIYVSKAYEICIEDPYIFNDEYKSKYEKVKLPFVTIDFEDWKFENRKNVIRSSLTWYIYDNQVSDWLIKNNNNIIYEENNIFVSPIVHSTTYHIKITDEIKREILNKSYIYDWRFPYSLEDISFFKQGQCLLYSCSHEEYCDIFFQNEQEYDYLKSIGVKFIDTRFIP